MTGCSKDRLGLNGTDSGAGFIVLPKFGRRGGGLNSSSSGQNLAEIQGSAADCFGACGESSFTLR